MSEQDLDYEAIRRKVAGRLKRRKRNILWAYFVLHVVGYVAAMVVLWGIALLDPALRSLIFAHYLFDSPAGMLLGLPTFGGGLAVLVHFLALGTGLGVNEKNTRTELLKEEIEQQRLQRQFGENSLSEKRKNAPTFTDISSVSLSDDGELNVDDEESPSSLGIPSKSDHLRH